MTCSEQVQAQKLADVCRKLGPDQMRLLLTFGEGFVAAMDHFGIQSAALTSQSTCTVDVPQTTHTGGVSADCGLGN